LSATPGGDASARLARVFNIPAGIAFVDALAEGLLDRAGDDPLAPAAMTVLLPTRRACRATADAFLRVAGGRALLLPRLVALAELEDEADPLAAAGLPAAPEPLERLLTLARLVLGAGPGFAATADQALRLARSLSELIDAVETEQVDFARLDALAPEEFAQHWQQTLAFLKIVTALWPGILEADGQVDPARRRVLALAARTEAWTEAPPADPVIAAGFVAADPALARLIGLVARLPKGMVVLPGLDRDLDDDGWDAIEPTHPQFGLKRLIEALGIPRASVAPWPEATPDAATAARNRLLSEALRPASTTDRWRDGPPVAPAALAGLARLDCETVGEEAEAIALAMRGVLEAPGQTAALVTPDRDLARRVAAALARWGVVVDDSAGRPLTATPVGVWLRLVADAAIGGFAPRDLLAMLKHPLAACGLAPEDLRRRVRALERAVLRGPRPGPGLTGLARALHLARPESFDGGAAEKDRLEAWLADLAARLAPLTALAASGGGTLGALVLAHGAAAEALAETADEDGALILWRGEDGEAAADLLSRLAGPAAAGFPDLPADRYPSVLDLLMGQATIRPLYGAHPRLAIWGLIEARLQRADLMILGGLNEGTWPPLPGDEPWMSRPMRARFGLSPPETRIGAAAQDFALAAAAPNVLLTRAGRVEGAPTVPARFLSRLDTLLAGSGTALKRAEPAKWRAWAGEIDHPPILTPSEPPAPCPPQHVRPRRLPVTAIETWMRDPYALYARYILRLRALDPLDSDPGAAERGEFIHRALDRFVRDHPGDLPADALDRLIAAGRASFGDALDHPSVAAFWWPRFRRAASWFVGFERERRREGIFPLGTEVAGTLDLATPGGRFTLTAKADRIDRRAAGELAILDYKTGRVPSIREVETGLAPQLPLEGLIAAAGGFAGITAQGVGELAFVRLTGGNPPGERIDAVSGDLAQAVADANDGLMRLIAAYDRPDMPYRARPRPEFARAGDYDHLERVGDWAAGSAEA
jgi:ATP-dependent helicase/nuclease subunit B